MLVTFLLKALGIAFIIVLVIAIGGLYKIFENTPDYGNNKSFLAYGVISEIVLIVLIAFRVITG